MSDNLDITLEPGGPRPPSETAKRHILTALGAATAPVVAATEPYLEVGSGDSKFYIYDTNTSGDPYTLQMSMRDIGGPNSGDTHVFIDDTARVLMIDIMNPAIPYWPSAGSSAAVIVDTINNAADNHPERGFPRAVLANGSDGQGALVEADLKTAVIPRSKPGILGQLYLSQGRQWYWDGHVWLPMLGEVNSSYSVPGTYYVSATGDDTTGDGSLRAPFRSVNRAVAAIDDSVGADTGLGKIIFTGILPEDGSFPWTGVTGNLRLRFESLIPPVALSSVGRPLASEASCCVSIVAPVTPFNIALTSDKTVGLECNGTSLIPVGNNNDTNAEIGADGFSWVSLFYNAANPSPREDALDARWRFTNCDDVYVNINVETELNASPSLINGSLTIVMNRCGKGHILSPFTMNINDGTVPPPLFNSFQVYAYSVGLLKVEVNGDVQLVAGGCGLLSPPQANYTDVGANHMVSCSDMGADFSW